MGPMAPLGAPQGAQGLYNRQGTLGAITLVHLLCDAPPAPALPPPPPPYPDGTEHYCQRVGDPYPRPMGPADQPTVPTMPPMMDPTVHSTVTIEEVQWVLGNAISTGLPRGPWAYGARLGRPGAWPQHTIEGTLGAPWVLRPLYVNLCI